MSSNSWQIELDSFLFSARPLIESSTVSKVDEQEEVTLLLVGGISRRRRTFQGDIIYRTQSNRPTRRAGGGGGEGGVEKEEALRAYERKNHQGTNRGRRRVTYKNAVRRDIPEIESTTCSQVLPA